METVQTTLAAMLGNVAAQLREIQIPDDHIRPVENLIKQLDDPCVVAVVGRMKAGKSTFINALLKDDLAPVGVTETTATINYFRAGQPDHPDLPVRCKWRGRDLLEPQSKAFLKSLQGNDTETLQKAGEIEYLEYLLPHAFLKQVTLVDTPGITSVIEEHQNATAEYMHMFGQLRSPYEPDSNAYTQPDARIVNNNVDAVIYLFDLPRASDQRFLDEFAALTGGKSQATNAIGVMARIDLHSDFPDGPTTRADKYATLLKDQLYTIIPVSAGLQRALDRLRDNQWADLIKIRQMLKDVDLAPLFESAEWYLEEESSISVMERKELRGDFDWTVFKTIVTVAKAVGWDLHATVDRLTTIAGFGRLRSLLQQHFFEQGQLIRSYRILGDALKIVRKIHSTFIPVLREKDRERKARLTRFLAFLNRTKSNHIHEMNVWQELKDFVIQHSDSDGKTEQAEKILVKVERDIGEFYHNFKIIAKDIEALQLLVEHSHLFSDLQEREELQALFGQNGIKIEQKIHPKNMNASYIQSRAQYWQRRYIQEKHPMKFIAEHATFHYGHLLEELRR